MLESKYKVNYLEFKVNTPIFLCTLSLSISLLLLSLFLCLPLPHNTNVPLCKYKKYKRIKMDLFVCQYPSITYPWDVFIFVFCLNAAERVDQWEIYDQVLSNWQKIQCKNRNASSSIMIRNVNVFEAIKATKQWKKNNNN